MDPAAGTLGVLPIELRNKIYGLILFRSDDDPNPAPRHAYHLFSVSKKISDETQSLFFSESRFAFEINFRFGEADDLPPLRTTNRMRNLVFWVTGLWPKYAAAAPYAPSRREYSIYLLSSPVLDDEPNLLPGSHAQSIATTTRNSIYRFVGSTFLRKDCRIILDESCKDLEKMLDCAFIQTLKGLMGFSTVSLKFIIQVATGIRDTPEDRERTRTFNEKLRRQKRVTMEAIRVELEPALGPGVVEIVWCEEPLNAVGYLTFEPRKHLGL